jgi:hypothetical protein
VVVARWCAQIAGVALSVVLLGACSSSIAGSAVGGHSVRVNQILPSVDQVAAAVGNPLDPTQPAVVGSIGLLPNGIRDSNDVEPVDCLGAATPLMRVVYEKGDVREVALRDFTRYGEGLPVSSVHTGVVRFGSHAEAARMFAVFNARWHACDGATVRVHLTSTSDLEWKVGDVRSDGAVLSDSVLTGESRDQPAFATEHALGLVDAYIVETDVAVTDSAPGRPVATSRAVALVRQMIDNVNAS